MANTTQPDAAPGGRFKQLALVTKMVARSDKRFLPIVLATVILPIALVLVLILALDFSWLWLPIGIMLSILGFLVVLRRTADKMFFDQAKGQPGAAAQIVEQMPARMGWHVTPAIATTTQMDVVSLAVGRGGIILLGEGHPSRVRGLIGQEKRRLAKVVGSAPMTEIVIGDGEGEVPLKKLRVTLMKLPRVIAGGDVNALSVRLKALTARQQMPKGAVPKNMRPPGFRQPRGR
jgi:hypothetical protein